MIRKGDLDLERKERRGVRIGRRSWRKEEEEGGKDWERMERE